MRKRYLFLTLLLMVVGTMQMTAYTLYYKNINDYKFAVWYWQDNESGMWTNWMTAVPNQTNWYQIDVPDEYDNVIFTSFDNSLSEPEWSEKIAQTEDLKYNGVNHHYVAGCGWQSDFNSENDCANAGSEIQDYERVKIGDLYYNLDVTNKTAEVTYQFSWDFDNYKGLTSANIHASVTYNSETYSVTSIGNEAFDYCSGLTSVTIGNSVTSIGEYAFFGCSGLTSVTIGSSVTSIGDKAFEECSSLTSISIPNSVTSIGYGAFRDCYGLTSIEIPNSVTSIGDYAFSGCRGLTSVTIGNSVTSIGKSAFDGCSGLTSVTIGNSVTSIGNEAFWNCNKITSVTWNAKNSNGYNFGSQVETFTFGDEVEVIPAFICSGMNKLSSLVIPNRVTNIGDSAFYDCVDLTSVTIPNSVINIGKYAFAVCCNLASITIPNTVENIGEQAFLGVHNIRYEGEATGIPWGALSVNSNVLSIPEITSITSALAANETSVDYYLFSGVISSIKEVATGYGNATFYISDGTNAFYCYRIYDYYSTNFTNSNQLHVGDSVVISSKVENHYYNSKFTPEAKQGRIVFHSANPLYTNDGVYYFGKRIANPDEMKLYTAFGVDTLNVPEKVTFGGNNYTVTEIASDAFYNRGELKCVKLPKKLQYMSNAFNKCGNIETIYYNAKKLNKPTKHSFADSKLSVKNVYIGEDVESLPDSVFCNLQAIEKVQWNAVNCSFTETLPPFQGCKNISNFTIGENVEALPNGLCYAMPISSVVIPNSVTSLGKSAFAECGNLDTLYLGENITKYGDSVFAKCTKLSAIYNYREKPAKLGKGAFDGVDYFNCTLYVLAESVDMYKSTGSDWKDFYFVEPIGANTTSLNANEVTVVPAETTALFTWPVNSNASTYTLQITKDGVVFCTLVFNGAGQLVGISFAPSRDGSSHAPAATVSVAGMSFSVTGLSSASKYAYNLSVATDNNQELVYYQGEFATTGYEGEVVPGGEPVTPGGGTTAIDNVNPSTRSVGTTKFFRNGQLFIQRGNELFNAQGARVK